MNGGGGGNGGGGEEEGNFCHNPENGPAITQNLPPVAIQMHLAQTDTPGHADDHLGPCLPGET